METDSWSRLSSGASKRLQSRYDLYLGFEEIDGVDDDTSRGVEYNCPFCGEDFDFVGFCCHVDDEHALEAKNGICPICAVRVGMDLVGHLTIQHASYFKMQRKRRHRKTSSGSHSLLSLLKKDFREREGGLHSLLSGSGSSSPDPLISSLIYNLPQSADSSKELDRNNKGSDENLCERAEHSLSEKDQKERTQRSKFLREIVLATVFDSSL